MKTLLRILLLVVGVCFVADGISADIVWHTMLGGAMLGAFTVLTDRR